MEKFYSVVIAVAISALLVLNLMVRLIQIHNLDLDLIKKVILLNLSVLLIMDILLQSNLMEKFYLVVLAITISASLVLILMALSIILLELVVQ